MVGLGPGGTGLDRMATLFKNSGVPDPEDCLVATVFGGKGMAVMPGWMNWGGPEKSLMPRRARPLETSSISFFVL